MRTLQAVWLGNRYPIKVNTIAVGLPNASWYQSHEVIMYDLQTALFVALGFGAEISINAGGYVCLWSPAPVAWVLEAAFATFLGFTGISYNTNNTAVTATNLPRDIINNQLLAHDLPVATWSRELNHLDSVVWRGPEYQWDVTWRVPWAQTLAFDPRRVPFVSVAGDVAAPGYSAQWTLAIRDGWIPLRPLPADWQRRPAGQKPTRAMGEFKFRCSWVGGGI